MPSGLVRALPWLLSIAAGAALLVAHPPVGWWWTTLLGPPLLVAAIHLAPARAGWLAATTAAVTFGPMLTWIVEPAGWLAWVLLVATQVGFFAVLGLLVRPWLHRAVLPVVVALLWTGIDAWRSVFPLGGFEWGAISYAHADGTFLLPVARVLGARGVTLLAVLIGVAAGEAIRRTVVAVRDRDDVPMERALRPANVPIAMAVGGLLAGVLITVEPPAEVGSLDVLAVQGNDTGPDDPRPPDPSLAITTAMRDLTVAALDEAPAELVVWPESSVDRDPSSPRGESLAPLVTDAAAALGDDGTLLAGMNLDGPDPTTQFVNAVVALDADAQELDRYVKRQPVPFGEYVPARRWLDWFPPLQQIPRDAVHGEEGQTVDVGDVEVAVGICFETLFPGLLRESVLAGSDGPAGLLVLVTNNASFGRSAQPDQHVAQSQLRAVESGRHVVHGALSGVSAFIAPDGQVTARTDGLFELATLRQTLPVVDGRTPFLVVGDVLGVVGRSLVVAALLAGAFVTLRTRLSDRAAKAPADG